MNWYYVGIGIVMLVPLVVWLKSSYHYRGVRCADFEKFIRMLMTRLRVGGVLVIEHRNSGTFVQFAKYRYEDKSLLHYGFPRAKWSDERFAEVVHKLEELDVDYHIKKSGNKDVPEFLEIEWSNLTDRSYRQASEAAIRTFTCFGVSKDDSFVATFSGDRDPKGQSERFARAGNDSRLPRCLRQAAKRRCR